MRTLSYHHVFTGGSYHDVRKERTRRLCRLRLITKGGMGVCRRRRRSSLLFHYGSWNSGEYDTCKIFSHFVHPLCLLRWERNQFSASVIILIRISSAPIQMTPSFVYGKTNCQLLFLCLFLLSLSFLLSCPSSSYRNSRPASGLYYVRIFCKYSLLLVLLSRQEPNVYLLILFMVIVIISCSLLRCR